VLVRRLVAVGAVVALLVVGAVLGVGFVHRSHRSAAPPTTVAPPKPFRVVFPEGFTRAEMAHRVQVVAGIAHAERGARPRLSRRTYLAVTGPRRIPGFGSKKRPLEGFLFPATYDFLANTTSRQLVRAQLQAFQRDWRSVNLSYARSKNLTPYDVLTIASMIEKEAQAPGERKLISAVIYNRLHARMPLGIDATIRYALNVPPTESLTNSQLHNPTPYNTRLHLGLPPTPIANPGLASMQAAAHPARVDYLYFVRKPDHVHHFFTSSFAEFQDYLAKHGYG
jgi:UPF0755 protein